VAVAVGLLVAWAQPAAADPPGAGIVRDLLEGTAGLAFDGVATGIANWVLDAVGDLVGGVANFLLTSGRPELDALWFSGPDSPLAVIRNLAGVALLAFVLLAVIGELVAGDLGASAGRIIRDLCLAVLGMAATVVVAVKLVDLTDALSAAVLGGADGDAVRFLTGFGVGAHNTTAGFSTTVIGLVVVVAALLVWVELLIRSALIYLLVALAPLAFAAMTWPAARVVLRRTLELLVAIIVSKFVIAVALAVGAAALGGAGEHDPGAGVGTVAATSLGALLSGGAVLALAAFSPFVVLKLIPFAEAAVVAHGISRGPVRGAQSGASTVFYAQSLGRLAGGRSGSGGGRSAPAAPGGPATGNGTAAAGGRLAGAPAAAGGGAAGGGAAAGAAAAGPAVVVAAGVAAGVAAVKRGQQSAANQASIGDRGTGSAPERRPPAGRDPAGSGQGDAP
jgi:hypothetical protein